MPTFSTKNILWKWYSREEEEEEEEKQIPKHSELSILQKKGQNL